MPDSPFLGGEARGAVVADWADCFGRTAASSHQTIILYIIKYNYIIIIASSARAEGMQNKLPQLPGLLRWHENVRITKEDRLASIERKQAGPLSNINYKGVLVVSLMRQQINGF